MTTQGSAHRGGNEVDNNFIDLYNKEFHLKRTLPQFEATSVYDIVLQENTAFSIAQLKAFLQTHEIKLNSDAEEELIGDETDVLKLKKIDDESGNKVHIVLFRSMPSLSTLTMLMTPYSKRKWRSKLSWARTATEPSCLSSKESMETCSTTRSFSTRSEGSATLYDTIPLSHHY